jgi:hypothetical protein
VATQTVVPVVRSTVPSSWNSVSCLTKGHAGMVKALGASGLLFLTVLSACGESPQVTWDSLFQMRDSTDLSDGRLAEIQLSMQQAGIRPWRVRDLNSSVEFMWSPQQGADVAASVMAVPREVLDTPYWPSFCQILGAPSGELIYVAVNLLYPIRVYRADGTLLDSLAAPPASWRQARRPELGEFPPQRHDDFTAYLQTFTMITGLAALADSVLVVTHGQARTGLKRFPATSFEKAFGLSLVTSMVDVYVNGTRVISDEPAPGAIFGYSRDALLFLKRKSPAPGWKVIEYGWKPAESLDKR